MSAVWKPGDVAMAYDENRSFAVTRHEGEPDYWSALNGVWPRGVSADLLDYRPLVVIDPEDAEQIKRLVTIFNTIGTPPLGRVFNDRLQAALRKFATPTPPKPEEPTGLGAVIEDAAGKRWVRVADANPTPWRLDEYRFCKYADIAAARVLSEGVTP